MHGLHLIADLHDCRCARALLTDVAEVEALCLAVCRDAGLTVVGQCFHQFTGAEGQCGATGAVVLAESHLTVHTWPELAAATVDLYVCNFSRDNRDRAHSAFAQLTRAFAPGHVEQQEIQRGEVRPADSA